MRVSHALPHTAASASGGRGQSANIEIFGLNFVSAPNSNVEGRMPIDAAVLVATASQIIMSMPWFGAIAEPWPLKRVETLFLI